METYTMHLSEEKKQEVLCKALQTFPLTNYTVTVTLLSEGIPCVSPKENADTVGRYMLMCKEKNVAPFVRMSIYENGDTYHLPGGFVISSVIACDDVRFGLSESMHKLHDIAANALVIGARPHMVCYNFKSPKAYARFMEKLKSNHVRDTIESMSIGHLARKYFAQDSLEFRVSEFPLEEKTKLHDWIEVLRTYEHPH